jgi:hypothetical protein
MTHLVLLNLVFFIVPTCGATAFAFCIYRFLKSGPAEPPAPEGGAKVPLPGAGPDDLARSA